MNRALTRTATVALVTLSLVLPAGATATARDADVRVGSAIHTVRTPDGPTNRFAPRRIRISRGDRVRWTNADSVAHTTTADGGQWSASLAPGGSYTRRFGRAGTFTYHCAIHSYMTGTIVVS